MRLLALLLLASSGGFAQAGPSAPLQACVEAVFSTPSGSEADKPLPLREVCPKLARDRTWLDTLPLQDALGGEATPAQVLDLRSAWASTRTGPGTADPLTPAALGAIIESMDTAESEPGLWEQFRAWLLERVRSEEEPPRWLLEWLENLDFDAGTAAFVLKLLMVTVVLLAIGVVLNELMKMDLRSSAAASRRAPARPQTGTPPGPADWDAVARLPASQQPAALLRFLLHGLDRAGIIALQRAWTNGEYAAAVRRRLPGAATAFARVVAAAECSVYGGHSPGDEESRALREGAVRVRDALEQGA